MTSTRRLMRSPSSNLIAYILRDKDTSDFANIAGAVVVLDRTPRASFQCCFHLPCISKSLAERMTNRSRTNGI
jgi:hypothetical protein